MTVEANVQAFAESKPTRKKGLTIARKKLDFSDSDDDGPAPKT